MTDELTLTLTRHIGASPANVWRCWTEPELLKQWFAPKPAETTAAEIDAQPGGRFRTVMVVPDHGEMSGDAGCFLVADLHKRLVWTNALGPGFHPNHIGSDLMEFAFTADIRMQPANGGCTYTATVMHATPEATKTHADMGFHDGWGATTAQLEKLAASL